MTKSLIFNEVINLVKDHKRIEATKKLRDFINENRGFDSFGKKSKMGGLNFFSTADAKIAIDLLTLTLDESEVNSYTTEL